MLVGATSSMRSIAAANWYEYFRGQDERGYGGGATGRSRRCAGEFAERVLKRLFLRVAEWSAPAEQSALGTEVSTQYEYLHRGILAGGPGSVADHHGGSQAGRSHAISGGGQAGWTL